MKIENTTPALVLSMLLGLISACNNSANDLPIENTSNPTPLTSSSNVNDNDFLNSNDLIEGEDIINLDNATPLSNTTQVSAVLKKGESTVADQNSKAGLHFVFPEVLSNDNGEAVIVIDDVPIPKHSARRELTHGAGKVGRAGDHVHFHYDMFSWSTGEMIESTYAFDGPLKVILGNTQHSIQIPLDLHNALLNRAEGTKMQVILPQQANGLPDGMNLYDGYVLMVEIVKVEASS